MTIAEIREIKLLPHQFDLLSDDTTPILGLCSGFGGGKTFAATRKACDLAIKNPGVDGIMTEPNFPLLTQILYPEMKQALSDFAIPYLFNKSEGIFYCQIAGKETRIICKSLENYDRLIGLNAAWAVLDEFDTTKKEVAYQAFQKLLGRLRAGSVRQMVIVSTPEGFAAMYKIFVKEARDGRRLIRARTQDNKHLEQSFIDSLIDAYPSELIEAYLLGNFVNLTSGTIYNHFNRTKNKSQEKIKPQEPLHIGQDFNVGNMASVVFVQRGDDWHAVDELSGLQDTPHLIKTIAERYSGHNVTVYPDASGASRKTVNASTSDIQLLKQAGLKVIAPKANPTVKDRILSVNMAFDKSRLFVNVDKCPSFAEGLEQQAYDKNGEPDKKGGLDHHPDAGGYFVHSKMPVVRKTFRNVEFRI